VKRQKWSCSNACCTPQAILPQSGTTTDVLSIVQQRAPIPLLRGV
jgi:hypothetical protein